MVRDIFHHHTARPDGTPIADGHSRQDGDTAAYPAVVADGHRPGPLVARIALLRVGAVAGRIDADIRADETVIANRHPCLIEHLPAEVGKKSLAHPDMLPVVAEEGLVDKRIFITLPQNLVQQPVPLLDKGRAQLVVFPAQVLHPIEFLNQLRMDG